ncbi:MAG: hypothetical protein ABW001_01290 [Mycobacterium sp.]
MARHERGVVWLIAGLVAVGAAGGCAKTSDGHPVAGPTGVATGEATRTQAAETSTSTSVEPESEPEMPTMGVAPTMRETIPPNALSCLPPQAAGTATTVQIGDPAAPRIVVSVPAGWSAAPVPAGVSLTGPDGMSGSVAITETDLDPAAAFEKYTDDLMASAPISSVSVLPAENCGYSGQRLMGMLSGGAQGNQTYEDRIAHIWTNTKNYLVAIHAGAPSGSPAFDAATPVLMADFAITIP